MTLGESIQRTVNLVGTTIVGLAGSAFLPEVIFEHDLPDKVDDGLLFIIGLVAVWWYRRARNRFERSVMPVVFVALALLAKIAAVAIEFGDKESVGDDFGALILFILALCLILFLYNRAPRLAEE